MQPHFLPDLAAAKRVNILGVGVSAVTLDQAVQIIDRWIGQRIQNYVCITGAHGIIESRRDADLCAVHNAAGLVTPDGMPLVFMARRLGFKTVTRVYGPDLMLRLSELSAQKGYRQFYYGGSTGLADRLAAKLRARFSGLIVAGILTPPFGIVGAEDDETMVAAINATSPDIVWVGLSTPKQELWMFSHRDRITAPVLIGVGAAFDFLAGVKPQAPQWMQRSGLEWAFRLACEPRRLWRRYARVVPTFSILAICQLLRDVCTKTCTEPKSSGEVEAIGRKITHVNAVECDRMNMRDTGSTSGS